MCVPVYPAQPLRQMPDCQLMVLAFIHARAVSDGGRCFPALVSSLLIHGDQSVSFDVWLSVCQFHTRCAVVNSTFCCATQLPFQFRRVALCCAFTIKSAGRGGYRLCHTAFAAAGLMAPSFRQGQFKTETHSANELWFCPYSNGHEPLFFLAVLRLTEGHLAVRIHSIWLPGYWRPRIKAASHDSSICYPG